MKFTLTRFSPKEGKQVDVVDCVDGTDVEVMVVLSEPSPGVVNLETSFKATGKVIVSSFHRSAHEHQA